jgi:hypothetical protein
MSDVVFFPVLMFVIKAGMDVPHGSMAAMTFFIHYAPHCSSDDSANLLEVNLILLLHAF